MLMYVYLRAFLKASNTIETFGTSFMNLKLVLFETVVNNALKR